MEDTSTTSPNHPVVWARTGAQSLFMFDFGHPSQSWADHVSTDLQHQRHVDHSGWWFTYSPWCLQHLAAMPDIYAWLRGVPYRWELVLKAIGQHHDRSGARCDPTYCPHVIFCAAVLLQAFATEEVLPSLISTVNPAENVRDMYLKKYT